MACNKPLYWGSKPKVMRLRLVFISFILWGVAARGQQYYLFAGSYTMTGSKGIYVFRFDAGTGMLDSVCCTEGVVNPSFLTVAPGGRLVYACTETKMANAGSLSVFSFDRVTCGLRLLSKQPSGGDNPVYVALHPGGKWAVMGNYTGGTVSVYPILEDGSVGPLVQRVVHEGRGVDSERQEKAHVHSVNFSPDGRFLLVPDLGMDKVMVYAFDTTAVQPLKPAERPWVETPAGSGPRHLAFDRSGQFVYVLCEMGGAIEVFRYDGGSGRLDSMQYVVTHGRRDKGGYGSADLHFSPDGRYLYASNRREENNLAIFGVDTLTGRLRMLGHERTRGREPRNFVVEPTGKYVLVANQLGDNIVVFRRNMRTGKLWATGVEVRVKAVTCLRLVER